MATISNRQWGEPGNTYHIANPRKTNLGAIIRAMQVAGRKIELVDEQIWLERIKLLNPDAVSATAILSLCRGDARTFNHHRMFDLFQSTDIKFDMRHTAAALENTKIHCPEPTAELLSLYIRNMLS